MTLPSVGGHHPICRGWMDQKDRGERDWFCLTPQSGIWIFSCPCCNLHHWVPEWHQGFPGPPVCRWLMLQFLRLHNHISQLLITGFIYIHTCIPLLLCRWRSLTNIVHISFFSQLKFHKCNSNKKHFDIQCSRSSKICFMSHWFSAISIMFLTAS